MDKYKSVPLFSMTTRVDDFIYTTMFYPYGHDGSFIWLIVLGVN